MTYRIKFNGTQLEFYQSVSILSMVLVFTSYESSR